MRLPTRPPITTGRSRMRIARLVMTALVLALVPTLQLADLSDQDPPSRVGRLSFLSGSVSFRPGSVDDWATATVNYPLTTGDHLWTDADARAEITVGSSAIRLAPQSAFGFLALDEDLDDYGDWRETGPYGAVWVPRSMIVGWAPYRYGHWAWVDPWGWTWIDDAPWGFAPFHYGRWVYVDDGWAWVPGHVVARPVYAPALVAFVGGRNWSVAIGLGGGGGGGGGGGVAWFPLGPEEPYVPGYHVSNTYIRNVNVTNVNVTNINVTNVNVTNITYRNRNAPGAVTAGTHKTFVESRPVGRSVIVVPRERLDK